MKKIRLQFIGSGKHAMMLKQLIISEGYEFVGFFDENRKKIKKSILGRLEDLKFE